MNVIDLFAQKFNYLLDHKRADGLIMGKSLERLPGAERHKGLQYYLRGYTSNGIVGFYWFSPFSSMNLKIPGHLLWIASCPAYNLEYVLDTVTGEVLTFSPEYYATEWPCAIDYEAFFKSLLIVAENEIEKAEKKTFELPESVLRQRYRECMTINGNDNKYSAFYEHIIGVDLNPG